MTAFVDLDIFSATFHVLLCKPLKRMKSRYIAQSLIGLLFLTPITGHAAETKLWYDKPATDWMTEALPIGNGDLGAMVFGKTDVEHIQFNEKSLWTGDENDTGAYQAFGDILIEFDGAGKAEDYRRELDLGRALQTISYRTGGVRFERQLLASHPGNVIVARRRASGQLARGLEQ